MKFHVLQQMNSFDFVSFLTERCPFELQDAMEVSVILLFIPTVKYDKILVDHLFNVLISTDCVVSFLFA